jgi:diguanylate cyclase (GGDEF)-like protein
MDAVAPLPERTITVTVRSEPVEELPVGDKRAALVMLAGPAPGQLYRLSSTLMIGRDTDADIHISDPAVSRRHARLVVEGGRYFIEDLGSANGILVAGAKVAHSELHTGDRIQIGPRVVFRFALLDEAEEKMQRQLFESSTRDPLTGAYNKAYLTERLTAEVAHATRHKSPLEVIVLDLDHFKQINDRYGHLAGDFVLREFAARVHALIRSEDVFARFGGEEFVVITRGSDAGKLAERIRKAVEVDPIPLGRIGAHVTVSLGVARLDELTKLEAEHLLGLADQRLLRAKRSGRNRTCETD